MALGRLRPTLPAVTYRPVFELSAPPRLLFPFRFLFLSRLRPVFVLAVSLVVVPLDVELVLPPVLGVCDRLRWHAPKTIARHRMRVSRSAVSSFRMASSPIVFRFLVG